MQCFLCLHDDLPLHAENEIRDERQIRNDVHVSLFRQLDGQKFMRQVTYKRPPDFVDRFAPPPSKEESMSTMASHSGSFAHVHRIKAVRDKYNAISKQHCANTARRHELAMIEAMKSKPGARSPSSADNSRDDDHGDDDGGGVYEDDSFVEDEDGLHRHHGVTGGDSFATTETKTLLSTVCRNIHVMDDAVPGSEVLQMRADVSCYLLEESTVLVLHAKSVEHETESDVIEAEAEVDLNELMAVRSATNDTPTEMRATNAKFRSGEFDIEALKCLARDIVMTLEIHVEGGVPRLMLTMGQMVADDEAAEAAAANGAGGAGAEDDAENDDTRAAAEASHGHGHGHDSGSGADMAMRSGVAFLDDVRDDVPLDESK